jgi:hypothetical protein
VLQLDCEGAEVEILREIIDQPRVILVETHGLCGAPTDLVASLLEARGYAVSHRGLAEPQKGDFCTKNDIRVLLGSTTGSTSTAQKNAPTGGRLSGNGTPFVTAITSSEFRFR